MWKKANQLGPEKRQSTTVTELWSTLTVQKTVTEYEGKTVKRLQPTNEQS